MRAILQAKAWQPYTRAEPVDRPLRDVDQAAERATVRFETPPGQQSQIDWGQARIHGTTHERPTDRFGREQSALIATGGKPGFRLEASQPRRVVDDYLVNFETNRYSVPFTLIGQTVEVTRTI
jgi:hypothetical protein